MQNVTVQSVTAPMNGGEVTYTYTDVYNGAWTTRPVTLLKVKSWNNRNISSNSFKWVDSTVTVTTPFQQLY